MGHLALDWEGHHHPRPGQTLSDHAREVLGRPDMAGDPDKCNFLTGAIICYQALSAYIERYRSRRPQTPMRPTIPS